MPWWRGRSWSTDLDTLTRLHKGLLALDVDPDAQHKPVPAPELPIPSAGPPALQEPLVPPQAVQVCGWPTDPVPRHSAHVSRRAIVSFFTVPCTASQKVISI